MTIQQSIPVPSDTQPAADAPARVTPMMEQYLEIKAANPGLLLFYRMGDFYELFFEDAEIASRALGIMLTKRGKHQGIDIPMCGVPVERSDDYLHRLIASGHRVADVGTGSGAVAVAVALRAPSARIWATDDSEAAVGLARANVARHGLEERVEVLLGDLLGPVPGRLDLVLANLPYHAAARRRGGVASAWREQPEHAIYAPGDGLQFNRDLIDACRTRLRERGALAIQLYGCLLSAGRGELDQLLWKIEARAAEGWEARVAADADGRGGRRCAWHASPA
jgi:hypothetical protein